MNYPFKKSRKASLFQWGMIILLKFSHFNVLLMKISQHVHLMVKGLEER